MNQYDECEDCGELMENCSCDNDLPPHPDLIESNRKADELERQLQATMDAEAEAQRTQERRDFGLKVHGLLPLLERRKQAADFENGKRWVRVLEHGGHTPLSPQQVRAAFMLWFDSGWTDPDHVADARLVCEDPKTANAALKAAGFESIADVVSRDESLIDVLEEGFSNLRK